MDLIHEAPLIWYLDGEPREAHQLTIFKENEMAVKSKVVPLLVTTVHKGVFFGYGKETTDKEIVLQKARMCIYWSTDMKGVHGLAVIGPSKNCKVGFAIPELTIQDITSIAVCTPEAAAAWEKQPWG